MKRQQFKATFLILLCILMQAVAVWPHHHHGERVCFKDVQEQATPTGCTQRCHAECATHFILDLPDATSTRPVRYDTTRCLAVLLLLLLPAATAHKPLAPYITHKVTSVAMSPHGLRAPPQL